MTIAFSIIGSNGSDTDGTDFVTGSVTPKPGTIMLVGLMVSDAGGGFSQAGLTGCGCTFAGVTQGYTGQFLSTWWAAVPNDAFAGALTFDDVAGAGVAVDGVAWLIVQAEQVATVRQHTGFGGDANRVTTDSLTLTLAAILDAQSAIGGFFGSYDSAGGALAFTAGTNMTLLGEQNQFLTGVNDNILIGFEYRLDTTSTSVPISVSAANDRLIGQQMEFSHWRPRPSGLIVPSQAALQASSW